MNRAGVRAIDASALARQVRIRQKWWGEFDADDMLTMISDAPTLDTRESVPGRWLKVNGSVTLLECSECGHQTRDAKGVFDPGSKKLRVTYPRYCSNCGADMRAVYEIELSEKGARACGT